MGFWSSLGSCISSACSAVGSGIRSCCSAVSNFVGSGLGKAVGFGLSALKVICPQARVLDTVFKSISLMSKIAGVFANVIKPNENIQDIGDRALQAEEQGITRESCKNYDEYMEKIRSVQLDPEVTKQTPESNKEFAGSIVVENGIKEKMPNLQTSSLWAIAALAPAIFTKERIDNWVKLADKHKIPLASISKFLLSTLGKKFNLSDFKELANVNADQGRDLVVNAEKQLNPGAQDSDIFKNVEEMKSSINNGFSECEKNSQ